jgi:hypothetical protein
MKNATMKIYREPAESKIVRFENEFTRTLASDLKLFITQNPFVLRKRQEMRLSTLSIA